MALNVNPERRGRPRQGVREKVMEAALGLFMERDYADVSVEHILGRAGVSRGAMYHHFSGKEDLFRAVWADSERRTMERIGADAAVADGPFEAMLAAARAYLREAETSEELRRVGLLQSRAVLGWEGWRAAAGELGLGLTRVLVAAAMDAGEIRRRDVETTTHMVLAALIEGATLIATAEDRAAVRAEAEALAVDLLNALR